MHSYNKYNEGTYYKIVKLKTGEIILCTMVHDVRSLAAETHLKMNIPVQVIPHQETRRGGQVIGESFILRPWIGLSDSEEFTISTDIVLTIGSLKREVRQQYINYVEQTVETQRRQEEQQEREEAVEKFLREITPGELYFVDEPLTLDNNHDENQG
jgi:hypothetical protein